MFHLAAYTEVIGNTADTDVDALTDDILAINNAHFTLDTPKLLLAAAAMSATILRAKVASPTMRQLASPFIRPPIVAAIPPANPNMWLLDHNPFVIPPYEEIQLQATSGVAMTERFTALLWLASQITPTPSGNVVPLRVTSSTTATANAWSTLTLTFADTIPSGRYAAVFSEAFSTNAQAHRWIFSNQQERPGYLSAAANTSRQPYAIARGQFGVMGYFRSNDLPRLQVLCNGADNSHEAYLHVIRVGNLN